MPLIQVKREFLSQNFIPNKFECMCILSTSKFYLLKFDSFANINNNKKRFGKIKTYNK